jgi:hypothetical protein
MEKREERGDGQHGLWQIWSFSSYSGESDDDPGVG